MDNLNCFQVYSAKNHPRTERMPQHMTCDDANGGKDEAEVELSGLLNEKVDIESVLSEKDSNFSVKTTVHIHRLFCECYPNSWPQEMREV